MTAGDGGGIGADAAAVAERARAWFAESWDPALTVAATRRVGLGRPTWAREWYGQGVAAHLAPREFVEDPIETFRRHFWVHALLG